MLAEAALTVNINNGKSRGIAARAAKGRCPRVANVDHLIRAVQPDGGWTWHGSARAAKGGNGGCRGAAVPLIDICGSEAPEACPDGERVSRRTGWNCH
jgi:hypothetical protein